VFAKSTTLILKRDILNELKTISENHRDDQVDDAIAEMNRKQK
jgi:hypothetical protein